MLLAVGNSWRTYVRKKRIYTLLRAAGRKLGDGVTRELERNPHCWRAFTHHCITEQVEGYVEAVAVVS